MPDTKPIETPTENPPALTAAGPVILPEPCPTATAFSVDGCQDAAQVTLPETELLSLGRIVQVDVVLKAICPGKRVAASIILMEQKEDGTKVPRGAKHILVPAQEGTACQDITLKCIPFSLPEALDPANPDSICNARNFSAQVIANYTDTDFTCCEADAVIV